MLDVCTHKVSLLDYRRTNSKIKLQKRKIPERIESPINLSFPEKHRDAQEKKEVAAINKLLPQY